MKRENREIINKVKKLLALSKSPNEHEAAIALQKAQQLLRQHELTMEDVWEISESNVLEVSLPIKAARKYPLWIQWLGSTIAETFGLGCYKTHQMVNGKPCYVLLWVGFETDLEIARHAFLFLKKGIESGSAKRRNQIRKEAGFVPRNFKNSYAWGFICSVRQKLKVLARKSEEPAPPESSHSNVNLPVLKKNAIQRYMDGLKLKRRKQSITLNAQGFSLGSRDGEGIIIRRPVNGSEEPRAISY